MKLVVTGEGKQDFIEGLRGLVEIKDSSECIIVEIEDGIAIDGSQYISLFSSMKTPVRYEILK